MLRSTGNFHAHSDARHRPRSAPRYANRLAEEIQAFNRGNRLPPALPAHRHRAVAFAAASRGRHRAVEIRTNGGSIPSTRKQPLAAAAVPSRCCSSASVPPLLVIIGGRPVDGRPVVAAARGLPAPVSGVFGARFGARNGSLDLGRATSARTPARLWRRVSGVAREVRLMWRSSVSAVSATRTAPQRILLRRDVSIAAVGGGALHRHQARRRLPPPGREASAWTGPASTIS